MKKHSTLCAILIEILGVLTLASCASEQFLSGAQSAESIQTDRAEAVMLWKQIQEQPGSTERLERISHGKHLLYEHAITASSEDFGMYYLIPYCNGNKEVEGCIIYPVDEQKPLETRSIHGTLGIPINMDADFLRTEIPENHRYLYAWVFLDLHNQGLQVSTELLQLASNLKEYKETSSDTRAANPSSLVDKGIVYINYQVSSYGAVGPNGEPMAVSISNETIIDTFEYFYRHHSAGGAIICLDQIAHTGFRFLQLKISCLHPIAYATLERDIKEQIQEIGDYIKMCYFIDIIFQYTYTLTSAHDVGGGSGHGTGGTKPIEGGFDSGGYDPNHPELGRPCRNDEKGKANPLVLMHLMPPNLYNIGGARFGYTRVDKYGEKKFHQGIDLMADINTPVYALFSGTIVGPYVTEQPNKIGKNYPKDYKGDRNGAGNRFGVRSKVNGKTITVYYWHLSADYPVAIRNGEPLKVGDYVQAGTIIGYTGVTGNAKAELPHLHLGIKDETGNWINPELYLNGTVNGSKGTISTPCDSYHIY